MTGWLLWDFDGTLAHRPGMWRGCLIETLDRHVPGHAVEADALIPFLQEGFPWHTPDIEHPELSSPDAWWEPIEGILARALVGVGIATDDAARLARRARRLYVDCAVGWQLFADTMPALTLLAARGWRHAVLSNHVPELPALVEGLGLSAHLGPVLTSAATGFEKPHPRAFALALEACGAPERVWMIGDNPEADVPGAEAAGIRAILVRGVDGVELAEVVDIVGEPR